MKLKQISGHSFVPMSVQEMLEASIYADAEQARVDLQKYFPNHLVRNNADALKVAVKDGSFFIAEFRRVG